MEEKAWWKPAPLTPGQCPAFLDPETTSPTALFCLVIYVYLYNELQENTRATLYSSPLSGHTQQGESKG